MDEKQSSERGRNKRVKKAETITPERRSGESCSENSAYSRSMEAIVP